MIITDESKLRIVCKDVQPEEVDGLRQLLEAALEQSAKDGFPGVGLACPQIGFAKNMAIVRIPDKTGKMAISIDLINPKIHKVYDPKPFEEGCLSFPGLIEKTIRFQEIFVMTDSLTGKEMVLTGLPAVVVQHEYDHLVGKLLPDLKVK